jgi:hypothetical protein
MTVQISRKKFVKDLLLRSATLAAVCFKRQFWIRNISDFTYKILFLIE